MESYYNYILYHFILLYLTFQQVVVLSLATVSPSLPLHFCLTPQPSLCLVLPVEDHPQLTLGQEMVKSSLTVPHYSIYIQVERSPAGFQNSRYRSTLTVTGRLPGVYQYSVTNRATSGMVTDTLTIKSKTHVIEIRRISGWECPCIGMRGRGESEKEKVEE